MGDNGTTLKAKMDGNRSEPTGSHPLIRSSIVPAGCLVLLLAAGLCASTPPGNVFWLVDETSAQSAEAGMVMICPSHKHGAIDQAIEKLDGLLGERPQGALSSVWVCRGQQLETIALVAPRVSQIVTNPFVNDPPNTALPPHDAWPQVDHPLIHQLRRIRVTAGERTRVLACINLDGEKHRFDGRRPTVEELEWMHFAAIGAHYQGIVWRADHKPGERLHRLQNALVRRAAPLGRARPVNWLRPARGLQASALATRETLFICLLHPKVMTLTHEGKVKLPLGVPARAQSVEVALPPGVRVEQVESLLGDDVSWRSKASGVVIDYTLKRGGDMLIAKLKRGD